MNDGGKKFRYVRDQEISDLTCKIFIVYASYTKTGEQLLAKQYSSSP